MVFLPVCVWCFAGAGGENWGRTGGEAEYRGIFQRGGHVPWKGNELIPMWNWCNGFQASGRFVKTLASLRETFSLEVWTMFSANFVPHVHQMLLPRWYKGCPGVREVPENVNENDDKVWKCDMFLISSWNVNLNQKIDRNGLVWNCASPKNTMVYDGLWWFMMVYDGLCSCPKPNV